jgi:hypothetical protein
VARLVEYAEDALLDDYEMMKNGGFFNIYDVKS